MFPAFLGPAQPLPQPPVRRSMILAELGGSASGSVRNFRMETQEQTQWCWSAVAVSVARKFGAGSPWTQCRLASAFLSGGGGSYDCCGSDRSACNAPQALSQVFAVTGNLNGGALNQPISFTQLREQIKGDRPVCARIGWPPDNEDGHFVAVTGFRVGADGEEYVDVQDPSAEDDSADNLKQMSLAEFSTNYDLVGGEWTWTYRTKP